MKIEYTFIQDDVECIAYFHTHRKPWSQRSKSRWPFYVLLAWYLGVVAALSIFEVDPSAWYLRFPIPLLSVPTFGLVWLLLRHATLLPKERPMSITLTAAGLEHKTDKGVFLHYWGGVVIETNEDGVYFWINPEKVAFAPRRAFRDETHLEQFVAAARNFKNPSPLQSPPGMSPG